MMSTPGVPLQLREPSSWRIFFVNARRFLCYSRGLFVGALLILCGIPALITGLIWLSDPEVVRHLDLDTMSVIARVGDWVALPAYLMFGVAYIRPLYAWPITTRQIVNTQLLMGIFTITVLHVVSAAFYRGIFKLDVPIWGPLLFLWPAIPAAAGLTVLLCDFRWWRPLAVLGATASVVWLFGLRGLTQSGLPGISAPPTSWLSPTAVEFTGITMLGIAGYWLSLLGVARDRCGEFRAWPDVEEFLHGLALRLTRWSHRPTGARNFRSARTAQFWYEFWQKGLILPIVALVLCGGSLIDAYRDPQEWLSTLWTSLPVILMFGLFVAGILLGLVNLGQMQGRMSEYRATRPLTDSELAFSVLKAAVASVLVSALVICLYAAAVFLISGGKTATNLPQGPSIWVVALFAGWSLCGLAASLALTGRASILALPTMFVFGAWLIRPVLQLLPQFPNLGQLLGWTGVLAIVLATVAAFSVALRKGVISSWLATAGGMVWMATAWFVLSGRWLLSADSSRLWAIAGLCILAAAPLATAPLAVSWNRHR